MSMPIIACTISKAAHGDEAAYARLRDAMRYNKQCGHWSQFPCQCEPRCPVPSEEAMAALNARLEEDLKDVKTDNRFQGPPGPPGPVGRDP